MEKKRHDRPLQIPVILRQRPHAIAILRGSSQYPSIRGEVRFFKTIHGTLVAADITGLPEYEDPCQSPVFGFHIHTGTGCSGDHTDPFANAMGHYNPGNCLHPHHAGDLPPLFGVHGCAFSAFLTDRFTVPEVIGRTIIIHRDPDDFTTQPAGNSGARIACGVITAL